MGSLVVSEGKTPKDFSDASLSSAVEQATRQIAALYSGKRQAESSELQFAIYPWESNPGPVILDTAIDGNGLTARDIQGTEITISGSSLEDLIQKGETMVPNPGGDVQMNQAHQRASADLSAH